MARVSRVSPRYNDRILHDDEEKKSEIGKGYREVYFFFLLNLLSNVCYVCYRSFQSKSYYRFTRYRLIGENIF